MDLSAFFMRTFILQEMLTDVPDQQKEFVLKHAVMGKHGVRG